VVLPEHTLAQCFSGCCNTIFAQPMVLGAALSFSTAIYAPQIWEVWLAMVLVFPHHLRHFRPNKRITHEALLWPIAPLQRPCNETGSTPIGALWWRQKFPFFSCSQSLFAGSIQFAIGG
jgi:hypothetical protein